MKLEYFKLSEFDSRDLPGSGSNMSKDLLNMLDSIRKDIERPIKINSGYRTEEHNRRIKGSPTSSHVKGLAVDIHVPDNAFRFALIKSAIDHGITRIGVYRTFIHLDIDGDKPQDVIWYV